MDKFIESINENINIQEVVNKRLKELLSKDYQSKRKIKDEANKSIEGFFKPDEVISVFDCYGYKFDDSELYVNLIKTILDLKKKNPEQDVKNLMLSAVKTVVTNYYDANKTNYEKYIDKLYSLFNDNKEMQKKWKLQLDFAKDCAIKQGLSGNQILEQVELQAREWYAPFLEIAGKSPSIKKIKGLGLAKCVEYAALTNQLLNFLGVKSIYVVNSLVDETGNEGHAYNIREGSNAPVLIDYLNNISIKLNDEKQAERIANGEEAIYDRKNNVCYGSSMLALKTFRENNLKVDS